jgi:hypothetical protein
VTAAGRTVASRAVRLPRRSVTGVPLRFGAGALQTLRGANGRATFKLALRKGARRYTARRALTLTLPTKPGSPGGPAPAPGPGAPTPAPGNPVPTPAPSSNRWVGRMGIEGAYDDLELTLIDGTIQITKTPLVPVYCFEMGGQYRSALSFEPFVVAGPWTVGTDGTAEQSGIGTNQLVSPGSRGVTYTVKETTRAAGTLTGKLGISYFDSKLDPFTYKVWFVNCSGTQSFEAVPAS